MKISQMVEKLNLETLVMPAPDIEVTGGYTGDLLSWVMGRAEAGDVWVTIMTNINILAVAMLSGVSAIVIAENSQISDDVIKKAGEQGINLLRSKMSSFDISLALGYALDL